MGWFGINRSQLSSERKIVADRPTEGRVSRDLWNEIGRILREATHIRRSVRPQIAKDEWRCVADPLVLNHVQINVQSIGPQNGYATLQLLSASESRTY